jgi:MFS family permease
MAKKDKVFGVNRNVFYLGLTSLFNDISTEMIYPIVPIFMTTVLGAPVAVVGLVEGIAESTASILKVFSGWISDKAHNRKGLAVTGYALSTIAKPILVFASAWWQVLSFKVVDRTGKGIRTSPRDALIADSTAEKDYGRAFGFHRSMDYIGATLGPLLAFVLLPLLKNDYRLFFALSIIPASMGVLLLALFVKEKRDGVLFKMHSIDFKSLGWRFFLFLVVVSIFSIGNSSDAFLILRAKDLGIPIFLIPLAYFVYNAVSSLIAAPAGIVSDKIGRKTLMLLGFLFFSFVYLGFAITDRAWMVWILFAVYGVYYAFTESMFKAYTADLVAENVRGTAYGLLNMVMGFALLPASLIAGFLWDNIAPSAPFFYGSITAALAFLFAILFVKSI